MLRQMVRIVKDMLPRRAQKQIYHVKHTSIEQEIIQNLIGYIHSACDDFVDCTGHVQINEQAIYFKMYKDQATTLMYCIEKHLYNNVGKRVQLGNTSICGGVIKTIDTSRDQMDLPRSKYSIAMPMIGKILVEYGSVAVTGSNGDTDIFPKISVVLNAFDTISISRSLFKVTLKSDIDKSKVGWK